MKSQRIYYFIALIVFVIGGPVIDNWLGKFPLPYLKILAIGGLGLLFLIIFYSIFFKSKSTKKIQQPNTIDKYLTIPSKEPFAWAIWLGISIILGMIGSYNQSNGLIFLSIVLFFLFILQLIYNLFQKVK